MGLDLALVELLCCAKNIGVDFSDTLTIGRQTVLGEGLAFAAPFSRLGITKDALSDIHLWDFGESLFELDPENETGG